MIKNRCILSTIKVFTLLFIMISIRSFAASTKSPGTPITITAGDIVITGILDDSETSRDFIKTLPITIPMSEIGEREFYGKIGKISANSEKIDDYQKGDIAYHVPGEFLAIYYEKTERPALDGLVRMGKITSGIEDFKKLENNVEMKIEVAK